MTDRPLSMEADTPPGAPGRTLVLGIGNILWADEGFGVRAVETLHRDYAFPDDAVTVMDGGTQGLYLVQDVRAADNLLVFDAIDCGREPGALMVVRGDEVPRFRGCRALSLHQTGFQDVLSAADLLGGAPTRLTLIGVQAGDLETWGGSLTGAVRARLDEAVRLALAELAAWGVASTRRAVPLRGPSQALVGHGIDLASYEAVPRPLADPAEGGG
ncbi:HyaD/HybD family hydrogenase maturation endopeptidase [Roseospira visakhapatnamensis]|uniref:Hydrogenase expression/formation protein HupD n=1 Tax=Roseospira visakhapatnamensis TaxID=390880 RepID=A0A7W6REJ9_9PROT|nr:HyaD/HybD family hydrogenase maturation endopeptidase [Roseospira visakhapatnamensis]MBB4267114.1 hydrogenase maturation protease [Roseospira visakhapatnamensis]